MTFNFPNITALRLWSELAASATFPANTIAAKRLTARARRSMDLLDFKALIRNDDWARIGRLDLL